MTTEIPTTHAPIQTRSQRLLGISALVWAVSGLCAIVIAGILTLQDPPSTEALLFAALLAPIAMFSDRFSMDMRFGDSEIEINPFDIPWVIAAIFLPIPLVLLVAAASFLRDLRYPSKPLFFNIGSMCLAVGVVASLRVAIFEVLSAGGHATAPSALLVLPTAVVCATLFELLHVLVGVSWLESREKGSALEYIRECGPITGLSIGLASLGAAVVAPFWEIPLLAAGVLLAFQIMTFAGLRLLKSEQVHRHKSQFLQETFSRYVPATVVDQLSEADADAALGGDLRDVSIMFVDVRNFTKWSEHLPPSEVIADLNELMGTLTQSIFSTSGTLDKFTGDGLMAFWGAPVEQPDHADLACTAALDMLHRLTLLNEERVAAGKPPMHIGIGIHSGEAIVGNVGHESRHDFTAIGDTVNTAARLEAATKDAGCSALISTATFSRLCGSFQRPLELLGDIMVKGKSDAVSAYILAAGDGDNFNVLSSSTDTISGSTTDMSVTNTTDIRRTA